jgi:phytoene synthase
VPQQLAESYRACQQLAKKTAKNFYYSFLTLPTPKRQAMCALYAFLRRTDDIGDDPAPLADRRARLAAWRVAFDRALGGRFEDPLLPAVVDTVRTFGIPPDYLRDAIDGVSMDLAGVEYETFAELEEYCYRVAGVVGLACVHIWGFTDSAALEPARQLGTAFQLTNILRDLAEDIDNDRVYLPHEDLQRFSYTRDDIKRRVNNEDFRRMMHFEIDRARSLYQAGTELAPYLHRDGLPALAVMTRIYYGVLTEIERRGGDVYTSRVSLSRFKKLRILAGSLLFRPSPESLRAVVTNR